MARRAPLGPLGLRLALAFVGVGLAAVALLAGLTLASTQASVASLGKSQEQATTAAVAGAVTSAYQKAGGWAGADLESALALAAEAGAQIRVFDQAHRLVASSTGEASSEAGRLGPPATTPVLVAGRQVGTVVLRFTDLGLRPADLALRGALVRRVGAGAGLAALLALAVAVVVARRITKPVVALTRAAQAMEAGQRDARVGSLRAPGELGELAQAFDEMADAVTREDQLRRALVADVAHELRTPISVLQGSCEAILDGVVEPSTGAVSSLRDEVLRLARMVEDLQVLSSAEAAGLRLDRHRVDLAAVAGDAAAALAARFAAAEVDLATTLEPVTVTGDPARLHQVVTNLLANAVKFTPPGGTACLGVGPVDGGARIEVADTGPGIPPDDLPHVFERFYRGRAVSASGSGIGLAVVAELVRAHGGTVGVDSHPGRGSRFSVFVPDSPSRLHSGPIGAPDGSALLIPVAGTTGPTTKEDDMAAAPEATGLEAPEAPSTEADTGPDVQQDGDFQGNY